jgi:hypothetical protein
MRRVPVVIGQQRWQLRRDQRFARRQHTEVAGTTAGLTKCRAPCAMTTCTASASAGPGSDVGPSRRPCPRSSQPVPRQSWELRM